MKVVYLLGEPAVGKSSVMRTLISHLGPRGLEVRTNLGLDGRHFNYARGFCYPQAKAIIMGLYDGKVNDGTDRLGLNTSPPMVRLLMHLSVHPTLRNWTVFMEGDRCANRKFIDEVSQFTSIQFYLLTASPETLAERHVLRGDTQTAKWLEGRQTKLKNILSTVDATVIENIADHHIGKATSILLSQL